MALLATNPEEGNRPELVVALPPRQRSVWGIMTTVTPLVCIGTLFYYYQSMNPSFVSGPQRVLSEQQEDEENPVPIPINKQPSDFPVNIQPVLDFWGGPNTNNWCTRTDLDTIIVICCGDCLSLRTTGFRITHRPNESEQPIFVFGNLRQGAELNLRCFEEEPTILSSGSATWEQCSDSLQEFFESNPRDTFVYHNYETGRVLYSPSGYSAGTIDMEDLSDNSNKNVHWRLFPDDNGHYFLRNEATREYLGRNEYGLLYTYPLNEITNDNRNRHQWLYRQNRCPDDEHRCATFRNDFDDDHILLDLPSGDPSAVTVPENSELLAMDAFFNNTYWVFEVA